MAPALTTKAENLLTWLGLWGAMRSFFPIAVALLGSVLLLESFTASAARLFPRAPLNALHTVAIGAGLLLGVLSHFAGEFWDRFFFEGRYGPRGRWLDTASRPLGLLPAGAALKKVRGQAAQAMKAEVGDGLYRQAVKLARRQVERWGPIEQPLILSWIPQGLLGPCLAAAVLGVVGIAAASLLGETAEIPRLLTIAAGSLVLGVLFLACYTDLRMTHMLRLYQDILSHPAKKK